MNNPLQQTKTNIRIPLVNRKALIIGSPGVYGSESYLKGVAVDLKNYTDFFRSPLGGSWRQNEITVLQSPSKDSVINEIRALKSAEYSIVIFSGHGYHDGASNSTIVELSSSVSLDSKELKIGAPKHTLILDCCRQVYTPKLMFEDLAKAMDKRAVQLSSDECRRYYDKHIADCANGIVTLYSCSVGESALDDASRGGVYLSSLLKVATQWLDQSSVDTSKNWNKLTVVGAHDRAELLVKQESGNRQNPNIQKPREEPYFPFAVIA